MITSVKVKLVDPNYPEFLPMYGSSEAACMDLMAFLPDGPVALGPGEVRLIPTNISIALPSGYKAEVKSRSGLAVKEGIFVLNAPGVIDADYRGEVKVILANMSRNDYTYFVSHKDRIAQLDISPVHVIIWDTVEELPETKRGTGGFGSTGR